MIEDELRAAFARHEPLTPASGPVVERIRQGYRRRRQRRFALRSAGAAVLAALVVTGPALAIHAAGARMNRHPLPVGAPSLPAGALNYLLLGVDREPGTVPVRADSVLIVHVPASRDSAVLVSVLRDLRVAIPGHGTEKLNAAYAYGGFGLVSRTLTQLTGLRFDGGGVVSFDGLRKVVDAAGGVSMYVDEKTTSVHTGFTRDGQQRPPYDLTVGDQLRAVPGVTPYVHQVGYQHLAGWQVADYLRQRFLLANADGDAGRQRHVRQFVAALLHQLRTDGTLADPGRLQRLLDAAGRAVTVDTGGVPLADLVLALVGIPPAATGIQVPVSYTNSNDERLGPGATSLFAALVGDDLPGWIAAHPEAVTPQ